MVIVETMFRSPLQAEQRLCKAQTALTSTLPNYSLLQQHQETKAQQRRRLGKRTEKRGRKTSGVYQDLKQLSH